VRRQDVARWRVGDAWLVDGASKALGGRKAAAAAFVEQGFNFYGADRLDEAMSRFNQAWLLDADNPEVYWGFAIVLHDRGDNCGAVAQVRHALASDRHPAGLEPDAGRMLALCGVDGKGADRARTEALFAESRSLFESALQRSDEDKGYVYATWATALYWQGEYAESWEKVHLARSNGGEPGKPFMKLLQAAMKDPLR
jgi:tetratricopeptide (TPR) repeat protein